MINIGNNVYLNEDKIAFVMRSDAEKVRRLLKRKGIDKSDKRYYEVTGEKSIRSVLILVNGMIVTSSVSSNIIAKRMNYNNNVQEEEINE